MRASTILTAIVLAAWAVPALRAADPPPVSDLPGYFPLEDLGLFERDDASIEINLSGSLLQLVAGVTRKEEPEFARLIDGLEAVRVRVAPLEDLDLEKVRGNLTRAVEWLEENGWQTIVRVREDDEETYIYIRELEDSIVGMAILAFEAGGEAAAINIVGKIDVRQLERLGEAFDIPQLSRPQAPQPQAPEDEPPPNDEKGSEP